MVLCSQSKRVLQRVKKLADERLTESDREKVLFLQPEQLLCHLAEEVPEGAGKDQRVKGYKVRVQHVPVGEAQEAAKRAALAQVIAQTWRRLKNDQ